MFLWFYLKNELDSGWFDAWCLVLEHDALDPSDISPYNLDHVDQMCIKNFAIWIIFDASKISQNI